MKKFNSRYGAAYISTLGVSAALTVALIYLIRIPFPMLPFLEYDPGDIPIYFCAFAMGPAAGLILTIAASVIQGLTVSASSGWIGIFMHIAATGTFTLAAGFIYSKNKTVKRLGIAVAAGAAATLVVTTLWNLVLTPYFMGTTVSAVAALLPLIILFNIIKVAVNSAVAVIIYGAARRFIKYPAKSV